MIDSALASMTDIYTEIARQWVAVADNAVMQRAVGLTNLRTAVRYGAGCQAMTLQKVKCCQPGIFFANTRVIKNTKQGARRQCIPC